MYIYEEIYQISDGTYGDNKRASVAIHAADNIFQEQSIFKVTQNPQRSLEQNIHPQLRAIKCKMYSSTGITLLVLLAVAGTTLAMAAGELKVCRTDGECFPSFPQQEMWL